MDSMHDVVIVGAGPGGAAAAHYLARQGMNVLMLDKSDFPRDKTCGDGLTPRALDVLDDMGLLQELYQVGCRINGLELHGARGSIMTAPIPKNSNYPDHLLIVPRLALDDAIRQCAISKGAKFQSPVRVQGVQAYPDHVEVQGFYQGKFATFKGRMAILAIGANIGMLVDMGILKKSPDMILAARAYYEGMSGLTDRVQAHFENVPLPGYGWVFPISETAANVGVGFWGHDLPWRKLPSSARQAMDDFLENPKIKAMLNGAKPTSPIKGFPLRVDFATAPTYDDRLLLVGETAGLVSPLTGEGIDFSLESGKLAAEFLAGAFASGDFSRSSLHGYDTLLRQHFQRLFVFLARIRRIYINPLLMNRAIVATEKFPELKEILVKIMMGEDDAASFVNLTTFRKIALGI